MDQPTIIHDITSQGVKAVLPEYGRVILPLHELLGEQAGARLLLLQPGREAQRRKLGLSWFFPQIRKYRRSLIEVLLASLVLQLLNLAQPLVMQQIFDKVIGQQNLDTLYTLGHPFVSEPFPGADRSCAYYLFADTIIVSTSHLVLKLYNIFYVFPSAISIAAQLVNFRHVWPN